MIELGPISWREQARLKWSFAGQSGSFAVGRLEKFARKPQLHLCQQPLEVCDQSLLPVISSEASEATKGAAETVLLEKEGKTSGYANEMATTRRRWPKWRVQVGCEPGEEEETCVGAGGAAERGIRLAPRLPGGHISSLKLVAIYLDFTEQPDELQIISQLNLNLRSQLSIAHSGSSSGSNFRRDSNKITLSPSCASGDSPSNGQLDVTITTVTRLDFATNKLASASKAETEPLRVSQKWRSLESKLERQKSPLRLTETDKKSDPLEGGDREEPFRLEESEGVEFTVGQIAGNYDNNKQWRSRQVGPVECNWAANLKATREENHNNGLSMIDCGRFGSDKSFAGQIVSNGYNEAKQQQSEESLAKFNFRKRKEATRRNLNWMQFLLLLLLLTSCSPSSSSGHRLKRAQTTSSSKLKFWRSLVEPLLLVNSSNNNNHSNSNNSPEALERLAERLASWPDQRRSALLYADLLASSSSSFSQPTDKERHAQPEAEVCKRASLAELSCSQEEFLTLYQLDEQLAQDSFSNNNDYDRNLANRLERAKKLVELNEFSTQTTTTASYSDRDKEKLLARLNQEAKFVELAQVCVENANLISRLLIQPESELIKSIVSRSFFKYLIESKLRKLAPTQTHLYSIGLLLLNGGSGSLDNHFAPQVFLDEKKQVQVLDLAKHQVASGSTNNGYFQPNQGAVQPFLARWLLADESELAKLGNKLRLSEMGGSLRLSDGRWFSPYFDCHISNRWLLTYSIPFFASTSSSSSGSSFTGTTADNTEQPPTEFRGVAFVSLDAGKSKLVDQCASSGALFANTNQCGRLQNSQCLRLASFEGVRSGAYMCRCPTGNSVPLVQRRLAEERRNRRASQVMNRARSNGSHSLDLMAFGSLQIGRGEGGEKQEESMVVGLQVEEQQRQLVSRLSYFSSPSTSSSPEAAAPIQVGRSLEPGSRLEDDVALDWFWEETGNLEGEVGWPMQECRPCRQRKTAIRAPVQPSSSDGPLPVAGGSGVVDFSVSGSGSNNNTDQCDDPVLPKPASRFLRPLVVGLQSFCMLITLTLVGFLLRLRKSRIIAVSGWLMLETTSIGALLLYTSPTSITCLLEPWFRELGFSIFYGSILIKLYRILTEFQTRKAHRVCFRDKDQIIYLLGIVLIVIGYMSGWTALMADGFFSGAKEAASVAANSLVIDETPLESSLSSTLSSSSSSSGLFQPLNFRQSNQEAPQRRALNYSTSHQDDNSSNNNNNDESHPLSSSMVPLIERLVSLTPQLSGLFFADDRLASFGRLFSGLLEVESHYDLAEDAIVYTSRCRKLTWDYVTELSELGLLMFGIYLVYKLRNASSEVYKEKLVLSGSLFVELLVSSTTYTIRHLFWSDLAGEQLLLLYCLRCQLTVSLSLALIFGPKLWAIGKSKPSLFSLGNTTRATNGSMRHRCHITCELHDHHLNDAMQLHQAMLSNAALEIGSINLADMDPDEIQAELKRVYAQLEMLKTKVMRRDNPHISKRRGGRKTGHRKFSLQAFHAKHLSHHHSSSTSSQVSGEQRVQQDSTGNEQSALARLAGTARNSLDQQHKLAVLPENEQLDGGGNLPEADMKSRNYKVTERRVRLGQQQQQRRTSGQNKTPKQQKNPVHQDPASTSSIGLYYDELALHEDSQSSGGNGTPPRKSSVLCSQDNSSSMT